MYEENICFLVVCVIFILLYPVFGEQNIKINEFAIDLNPQQVELINTSSSSADISNWYLDDSGGTTYYTLPQNTYIYPNSCLVFSSDLNLNKSSPDTIRLFDNTLPPTATNASLIDSYAYKSSPGTGKSYLRNPDGENNWIAGVSTLGQYNLTGQNCVITPTLTPTPSPTPTPIPKHHSISYPYVTITDHRSFYKSNAYFVQQCFYFRSDGLPGIRTK